MAAILCNGINQACQGCCECAGAVCKAPFQLCHACSKGCGQCCDGCGQCLGDTYQRLCTNSFCCYVAVTCALNIPPIVLGWMDLADDDNKNDCHQQERTWLLIFWPLCLINIVAAIYMSVTVDRTDHEPSGNSCFGNGRSSSNNRMKQLFCYDAWMALYIVILLGFVIWLFFGTTWFAMTDSEDDNCNDESEEEDGIATTSGRVTLAYSCGWAFLVCGGCALCCGVLHPKRRN